MNKILRNSDVIGKGIFNSFASYKLISHAVLECRGNDAGITMSAVDGYDVWLKSQFQKLSKPDTELSIIEKAKRDFNVSNDNELTKMRTVGCGTNVFFILKNGVFYAAVQRTAVNNIIPAFSRAAGGSIGDIDYSALAELNEEMFAFVRINNKPTLLNIIPEIYNVSDYKKDRILSERIERTPEILLANNNELKFDVCELNAPCLFINGLTESVNEIRNDEVKTLKQRVFVDAPSVMDVNGVDAITYVHLPNISSNDFIGIYDGELDTKGTLLNRKWTLFPIDKLYQSLVNGEINMSPTPRKVVETKDAIIKQINLNLGL